MKIGLFLALILLSVVLAGCTGSPAAPVSERSLGIQREAVPIRSPETHKVQQGDTLYGIAFRYGLDFREIAAWNQLGPNSTIHPGQPLRLTPPGDRPVAAEASQTVSVESESSATPADRPPAGGSEATPLADQTSSQPMTLSEPEVPAGNAPKDLDTEPTPVESAPSAKAPVAVAAATTAPKSPKVSPPPVPVSVPEVTRSSGWQWPADGEVIGSFSTAETSRKGIDIAGKAGEPVRAASGGEVVYSGTGLVGYGELIIVKHSDTLLSAYAHNRKRLVKEGQNVASGEKIAELGSSGANSPKLHFEIRQRGVPVDPLKYLPKRG